MKRFCRLVGTVSTFMAAAMVASLIFYVLWYVHNDHPGYAAIVAGVLVTIYEFPRWERNKAKTWKH